MDISKETNIEKLESLAYRQIKQMNLAQANIQALEQRIAELNETTETPKKG